MQKDKSFYLGVPSEEILTEIGRVVVLAAQVDHMLKMVRRDINGWSVEEAVAQQQKWMTGRLTPKIRDELKIWNPVNHEAKEYILHELELIDEFSKRRNDIVHGIWGRVDLDDDDSLDIQNTTNGYKLDTVRLFELAEDYQWAFDRLWAARGVACNAVEDPV